MATQLTRFELASMIVGPVVGWTDKVNGRFASGCRTTTAGAEAAKIENNEQSFSSLRICMIREQRNPSLLQLNELPSRTPGSRSNAQGQKEPRFFLEDGN